MELKIGYHCLIKNKMSLLQTDLFEIEVLQITEKHIQVNWLTSSPFKEWFDLKIFKETYSIKEIFTTKTDNNGTHLSTITTD